MLENEQVDANRRRLFTGIGWAIISVVIATGVFVHYAVWHHFEFGPISLLGKTLGLSTSDNVVIGACFGACLGQLFAISTFLCLVKNRWNKFAFALVFCLFLAAFIVPLVFHDSPKGNTISWRLRKLLFVYGPSGVISAYVSISLLVISGCMGVLYPLKHFRGWHIATTIQRAHRNGLLLDGTFLLIGVAGFLAISFSTWGRNNLLPIGLAACVLISLTLQAPIVFFVMRSRMYWLMASVVTVTLVATFAATIFFLIDEISIAPLTTRGGRIAASVAGPIAFCFYFIAPLVAARMLGLRLQIPAPVTVSESSPSVDPLA